MSTHFIGNNTIRLPTIESTNTYAQELIKRKKPPEGTVVIADEQSQGRGQRGNFWVSEPGKNLTFSLILYPTNLAAENRFLLTQVISLALVDFIERETNSLQKIKIKWPNDIYLEDKKIAGILIENSLRGNDIYTSVIGIGLNVNQEIFDELNAISLKKFLGKNFDLLNCLKHLCSAIEARYLQFINKNFNSLNADYHQKLYRLNENITFEIAKKLVVGKITGVSNEGELLVKTLENTKLLRLGLKEVKYII